MPDTILRGNPLVLIGGAPAAGVTHSMTGGGMIVTGAARVFIGNPALDADGNLVPTPPECQFVLRLMDRPPDNLSRFRSPYQVVPGSPMLHKFPQMTQAVPAQVTFVMIHGHRIQIISPGPGVPVMVTPAPPAKPYPGQLPTPEQVAAALANLSEEQLSKLDAVVLSPTGSEWNAYYQQRYRNPYHTAAAETGNNVTTIFPTGSAYSSAVLGRVMQHEVAHLVWHDLDPSQRNEWQAAMDADRRAISAYGNSAATEDFADAVLMYSLVKGTPCEATMKAAFPKRFALLEEIFSQRGFHTP
ncbi:MAG: hypothetical protein U0441_09530 [Polyangiaceae bacterium]